MSVYSAYGLRIESKMPLPELPTAVGPADVTIELSHVLPAGEDQSESVCRGTPEDVHLMWKDVALFSIQAGTRVVINPANGIGERELRTYLLGPVFGTLLHQRGCLVLHASGVAGPEGAILFVGDCGWGKSTTAATLHAHGWPLLTDDVAALDEARPFHVLPGFPRCKLWPDAVHSLGLDPEAMPRIIPHLEKRDHRIQQGFFGSALHLDRIYVLGEGPALRITRLTMPEAFIGIIRHRYANRVLDITNTRGRHFQQVDRLIRQVPVYRLARPRRLDMLALVIEELKQHFQPARAA